MVSLWKNAFHHGEIHEEAVAALGIWIALADERRAAGDALDAVAPELLFGTAAEQEELADVLREWTDDPRRPSPTARRYLIGIGQEVRE